MKAMSADKANTHFPFGSLYPLWGHQVPYTTIKFVGFCQTQDAVHAHLGLTLRASSWPSRLLRRCVLRHRHAADGHPGVN